MTIQIYICTHVTHVHIHLRTIYFCLSLWTFAFVSLASVMVMVVGRSVRLFVQWTNHCVSSTWQYSTKCLPICQKKIICNRNLFKAIFQQQISKMLEWVCLKRDFLTFAPKLQSWLIVRLFANLLISPETSGVVSSM